MRTYLRIGEVAHLLAVTTKTIRHYHKVGLLAEPERTHAEYRLYGARDVLRLLHIRRLQDLGLSLAQIKSILGEPEEEDSLRRVLERIAAEIDDQMRQLQLRRERIQFLLAQDSPDAFDNVSAIPPILALVQTRLAEHDVVPDETAWKQDRAIFGALDALHLPESARRQLHESVRRVIDDPEQLRRMAAIGERFAALSGEDADSPQVDLLVDEILRSNWLDHLQAFHVEDDGSGSGSGSGSDLLGMLFTEMAATMLSPAQQRFLHRIGAQQRAR